MMSEHISADQLDRYADAATAQLRAERDDARRQMQSLTEDYVAMEARAVKAEATVREQAEQLDIQTALATNYAGKAVEYKQEKERAEEQLDTLRNAIGDPEALRALADGARLLSSDQDWLHGIADAVDALVAAGGGVPEEGATNEQ